MKFKVINTTDGKFRGREFEASASLQIVLDDVTLDMTHSMKVDKDTIRFWNSNYDIEAQILEDSE